MAKKKKKLENLRLEKSTRWIMSSDNRGPDDDCAEIVEVSLGDSPKEEDEECSEQEYEVLFTDDDSQFFVLNS